MTNTPTKTEDKKPIIFNKPASPFSADPHNNRGGKSGKKGSVNFGGGGSKMKSINVPKFKGGSGGDR